MTMPQCGAAVGDQRVHVHASSKRFEILEGRHRGAPLALERREPPQTLFDVHAGAVAAMLDELHERLFRVAQLAECEAAQPHVVVLKARQGFVEQARFDKHVATHEREAGGRGAHATQRHLPRQHGLEAAAAHGVPEHDIDFDVRAQRADAGIVREQRDLLRQLFG